MFRKLLCALLLLCVEIAPAQIQSTYEWLRIPTVNVDINASYIDYITALDPDGNVYLSGYKENGFVYGVDAFGDVFLNKYTSDGELLSSTNIHGEAAIFDLKVDHSGNLYMFLGYLDEMQIGNASFDNATDLIRYVLVKLDSNANLLWTYFPNTPDTSMQEGMSMIIAPNNELYLGYGNYMNTYITRLSSDGVELSTIVQTGVNMLTSLDLDAEGNLYATGSCAQLNANYNGVSVPTDLQYTIYLVKYSPTGVFQWVKYREDVTCPLPKLSVHSPEHIYWSSFLWDDSPFDDLAIEGPLNGGTDVFIARLNADGDFLWIRELPGAGSLEQGGQNFLKADGEGNVCFAGNFRGNINWGNNTTVSEGFSNDAIFLMYNPEGELLLATTATSSNDERFDSVVPDNNGNYYLSGMGYQHIQMGDLHHDAGATNYFPFLTKISTQGLSINQPELQSITVYPNPTENYLFVDGVTENTRATLFNLLGQKVKDVIIIPSEPLNITDLPSGIYLLKTEKHTPVKFVKK
jgi:hypothetical protein